MFIYYYQFYFIRIEAINMTILNSILKQNIKNHVFFSCLQLDEYLFKILRVTTNSPFQEKLRIILYINEI
ncbi:hypothetical protein pb186bvf_020527 [Paramecium bursaria]